MPIIEESCGLCIIYTPPLFSITAFPYQPYGWENNARFLAPDIHAGKLREIGAQCLPLFMPSIEDGSNRTAGAPVEPNRKTILIFFAYLARGARILPCFNGIMVIPLDMTCDQACHHALGSLSRMEHRNRERNELRLHARSHTGRFDLL